MGEQRGPLCVIEVLDEVGVSRGTGASSPFISLKGRSSGHKKKHIYPKAVSGHTVISIGMARVTIQDSQLAGLLGPRCFLPRGAEGRPVTKFRFFFAESAVSIGLCSRCLVPCLVFHSETPFLGALARPPALLDISFVPNHLPHAGGKDDHLPIPCISTLYKALIRTCSCAQLLLFQPQPHRPPYAASRPEWKVTCSMTSPQVSIKVRAK